MEHVQFNDECKKNLIKGVNLVSDCVAATYGPSGRNVMIKLGRHLHVTKDGSTVATYVTHEDPYVQMGIDAVRDISRKTSSDVGDGSTTATILSREIVKLLADSRENPIQIQRDLQEDCEKVVNWLKEYKRDITEKDLVKVATLSANNDIKIGTLVADAFKKVGKNGIVKFEKSKTNSDGIEFSEGFQFDNGYFDSRFVNTAENTCVLQNVMVYISDVKISEITKVAEVANEALRKKKALLLIAPDFDSEIKINLLNNLHKLDSCMVVAPNFGIQRSILLSDIKDILGETLYCDKVIATADTCTFVGYKSNEEAITEKVNAIQGLLEKGNLEEADLEFQRKRLANFTAGIATIYVGGYSEIEVKERLDRVEDAVGATRAALRGGVLPGGGSALFRASIALSTELKYLKDVLTTPYYILYRNCFGAGECKLLPASMNWSGYNFKTREWVGDLYEEGVIDPYEVVKTSLENAVNTASIILTCSCLILNA